MGSDPWIEHLVKYRLIKLHQEAQQVGYRVRVVNEWTFDLEYEGGLAVFYQPGKAVKTFEDTPQGRAQARAFLQEVYQELARSLQHVTIEEGSVEREEEGRW